MRLVLFLPLLFLSCASRKIDIPKPELIPPVQKSRAGKVTFSGLSEAQLGRIRVIPENGRLLEIPTNRTYDQVDGFWWEGEARLWFKIPDYSEVWVGESSPKKYVKLPKRGGLPVAVRNLGIASWVRLAMGKVGKPGWYPDAGTTRSPVSSPWRP